MSRKLDTHGIHSDGLLFGIGHRAGSRAAKRIPCSVYIASDCR